MKPSVNSCIIVCLCFVLAGFLLLSLSDDPKDKYIAWTSIVFFGLGALYSLWYRSHYGNNFPDNPSADK